MGNMECCAPSGPDEQELDKTTVNYDTIMKAQSTTMEKYKQFEQDHVFKPLTVEEKDKGKLQPLNEEEKKTLFYHCNLIDPQKTKDLFEKLASSKAKANAPKTVEKYSELNPKCIIKPDEIQDLADIEATGNEQIKKGLVALILIASDSSAEFGMDKSHGCAKAD